MPLIYETIITSLDADDRPYIAPFGIRERGDLVIMAPFRPSISLDNILLHRCAVMNLTDDVRVFAGALTGRRDWPSRPADKVHGVVLESALAHRELQLLEVREDAQRPELVFKVVHEAQPQPFRGFNRAQAAVIELAVLVSRLHMLPMEKIDAEMAYLNIAIEKTAGEREMQAWQWLVERVENYRAETNLGNMA
ncbi:MAG: DUF447 domain-containing protein [Betaproteobacteria bacterium HGW-Betaproteobacteria-2]|nr:MAG: DUF447 domain-containing protein [Betaproteobacteria bacterium HGW-Betaproteobacteria-2]